MGMGMDFDMQQYGGQQNFASSFPSNFGQQGSQPDFANMPYAQPSGFGPVHGNGQQGFGGQGMNAQGFGNQDFGDSSFGFDSSMGFQHGNGSNNGNGFAEQLRQGEMQDFSGQNQFYMPPSNLGQPLPSYSSNPNLFTTPAPSQGLVPTRPRRPAGQSGQGQVGQSNPNQVFFEQGQNPFSNNGQ
jgi:hypothetical protein